MTIAQLGSYLVDLGFVLGFFHSAEMLALSTLFETIGSALETGTGTFSVKVGNAAQVGQWIGGLGFVFGFFPFLKPAQAFVTQLGAELGIGAGTFGPIRVGNEGISGTVTSIGGGTDSIAFTIAPWSGS